MTRRIRSFLIENTLGKVFTGVRNLSETTPDKLIAGTKLLVKSLTTGKSVVIVPTKNLGVGSTGMYLSPSSSLITRIDLSVTMPALNADIIIALRKGTSYTTSTVVGTYTLPKNAFSASINDAINIDSTETLYFDIIQSGSTRRGSGLSIRVNYYTG